MTRLRNAIQAKHRVVEVPASNLKKEITKILFEKGYILNYKFVEDGPQGQPECYFYRFDKPMGFGAGWGNGEIYETSDMYPAFIKKAQEEGNDKAVQVFTKAKLAEAVHALGGNVWVYTGWRYEALVQEADPARLRLLAAADVLVDGPYVESERSLELRWRGSRNQRLIDLNATRRTRKLTLLTE